MTDMDSIEKNIDEIKSTTRDIYKILNGNGNIGLVTQAQLNKQAINRAWRWLWAISTAILGIAGYIIKCGVVK
jgi:hypothetical protein